MNRLSKKIVQISVQLYLLCCGVSVQAEQWCASVSGSISGHECFSSEAACNDAVATAKREQGSGSSFRYTDCTREGGDTNAGSVDAGDDLIAKGASGMVDGMMSGNANNFSAGALGILGGALIKGMQGDPGADARRAQEAANRAAQAAAQQREYELQQAREEEARKQRLLGEMMDMDSSSALSLEVESNNDLGLMLGDEAAASSNQGSAIMPNRKERPKLNPHIAVRKEPVPLEKSLASQMMTDETTVQVSPQPQQQVPDARLDDAAWQKGNTDGSQCFSPAAGTHCVGTQGVIHQSCIANYEAGYRNGEALKRTLLANARQEGIQDQQQSRKDASFTHPAAQGPCRQQWIDSYKDGYLGR